MRKELYARFSKATFGDMFLTRNGCRAIYIEKIDELLLENVDNASYIHIFYVEGVGCKRYYDDGCCTDGISADDIVGKEGQFNEDKDYFIQGWQIAKTLDCLFKCKRYITAVERRNHRDEKRIKELLDMIKDTNEMLKL